MPRFSLTNAPQLKSTLWLLTAGLCLGLASPFGAQAETIKTIDGKLKASVKSIAPNAKKVLVVTTDQTGANQELPLKSVRSIEFNPRGKSIPQESPIVILTNGDRLRGQIIAGNEDGIEIRTVSLGKVKVSLERLRGLVLDTTTNFQDVEKNLRRKSDKDLVYLKSGSKAGGVLEQIQAKTVGIDVDQAGRLSIKTDKIRMIVMSIVEEAPALPKGTHVRVRLIDGSYLTATITSLQGESMELQHLLGKKLKVRKKDILEMFVLNGNFLYLSDMKPSKVVQKFPQSFQYYPDIFGWKRDRSVMGGILKLGGKNYEKGLGVHSYCALTFSLKGEYTEFRAMIGLDDSVRFLGEPGVGSVRFRVLVDGKPCAEFKDGILKNKGDDPQKITVSVKGAKTLTILADYGPLLHILGRANWADAHLIRKQENKE